MSVPTAEDIFGPDLAGTRDPLVLDPSNPFQTAKVLLHEEYTVAGWRRIVFQGGVYYTFSIADSAYQPADPAVIRATIYRFLEPRRTPDGGEFKPTKNRVDQVLDALAALSTVPADQSVPCWLDGRTDDPLKILAVSNGLLHITNRQLAPPSPRFFTLNGLAFRYDRDADIPTQFLAFLESLWPDDPDNALLLQEWIGYLLTTDTSFQKILMMVGPKRAGKGTLARLIRQLIGARNVCNPTLANLGEPFGRAVLIGKPVAIISDARISGRTDAAVVAESLLSISGQDSQTIPRKYLPDWTGTLPTRFTVMTNELPKIEDASGALASRFLVLRLTETFYGREDHQLDQRLSAELPGILNWALDGYDRLYSRGKFTQPESSAALVRDFEDLGSPVSAFLRERCDVAKGAEVTQVAIFDAWKTWCAENGREHPGTIQTLGRNLRAVLPWLDTVQHRVLGRPTRYWTGLSLRGEAQ